MIANYLGRSISLGWIHKLIHEWKVIYFWQHPTHDDGDPPGEHYEKLQVAHANLWLNTKFYKR